jgi:group I intron endonuclease
MDDTYVIYKHTSPSGKSYIGQTKDYDRRCTEHQLMGCCRAFNSAIKKYGWDNLTHEILIEGLSLDEANRWEEVLIKELNTLAPNGYNLMTGGMNSSHSDESKAKMSAAHSGIPKSEETKAKISAARLGKKRALVSEETKAKMSEAKLGKTRAPHSDESKAKMRAAKQNISGETRAKMSAARKGRIISDETTAKLSAARVGKKRGPRGPYKKTAPVESDMGCST